MKAASRTTLCSTPSFEAITAEVPVFATSSTSSHTTGAGATVNRLLWKLVVLRRRGLTHRRRRGLRVAS